MELVSEFDNEILKRVHNEPGISVSVLSRRLGVNRNKLETRIKELARIGVIDSWYDGYTLRVCVHQDLATGSPLPVTMRMGIMNIRDILSQISMLDNEIDALARTGSDLVSNMLPMRDDLLTADCD